MFAKRRQGVSLRVAVDGPKYVSDKYGDANEIDCSAVLDGNRLSVFATNRSLDETAQVKVAVADREVARLIDGELLRGSDPKAENTFERQNLVRSIPFSDARCDGGSAALDLPPLSFAAVTLELR
jgi:alpha-N-arabinofuranosidase